MHTAVGVITGIILSKYPEINIRAWNLSAIYKICCLIIRNPWCEYTKNKHGYILLILS